METSNERPPRYRWPWLVLAIVWMSYAVHRQKQQRDLNAPLPGAPARH